MVPPPPPSALKKEYPESHPFGHELAQVSELAEEYAAKETPSPMEAEEQELLRKGLKKFSAEDYLGEIQVLVASMFSEAGRPIAAIWI